MSKADPRSWIGSRTTPEIHLKTVSHWVAIHETVAEYLSTAVEWGLGIFIFSFKKVTITAEVTY
jgi:hypothetical protein